MSDRTRTCISGVAVRCVTNSATLTKWWALLDSNQRSIRYERIALTTKLRARIWWGRKEFAPPQLSRRIYSPVGSLVPSFPLIGRSSRIRTYDLLVPNQAHYQAALHPAFSRKIKGYSRRKVMTFKGELHRKRGSSSGAKERISMSIPVCNCCKMGSLITPQSTSKHG